MYFILLFPQCPGGSNLPRTVLWIFYSPVELTYASLRPPESNIKEYPLCGLSIPVGFIHCGQGEVWSYGKLSGFSGATGDLTSVVSPSAAKELQGVCGVSQGLSVFGSSVSNKNVPPHVTTDKFGSTKVVPAPLSSEKVPADPCISARYFKN